MPSHADRKHPDPFDNTTSPLRKTKLRLALINAPRPPGWCWKLSIPGAVTVRRGLRPFQGGTKIPLDAWNWR